tara:strand:- start:70825 stop:72135 length:1311 start_codon:yes stop_codon:yes gene_type:complete
MKAISSKCSYYDLIPQSRLTLLHEPSLRYQHIKLLCGILTGVYNALTALFVDTRYVDFDPHVGDTLCQIRALQVIEIANDPSFDVTEWLENIEKKLLKAKLLLPIIESSITVRRAPEIRRKEDRQTLAGFLAEYDIDFIVPSQVDYLTKSYMLTTYKYLPAIGPVKINYQQLCSDLGVSRNQAARIVHAWQKSIASYSCEYIKLIDPTNAELTDLMTLIDDNKREILPCFFVMKKIIEQIKKNRVGIQLVVNNPSDKTALPLIMLFQVSKDKFVLAEKPNKTEGYFTAYAVSTGIVGNSKALKNNLVARILSVGIETILLASVVSHSQYSGEKFKKTQAGNVYQQYWVTAKKEELLSKPLNQLASEYTELSTFALQQGCNRERPSFIYIEHIFAELPYYQNVLFDEASFQAQLRERHHIYLNDDQYELPKAVIVAQ